MARTEQGAAEKLATAIVPLKPTTREMAALYAGWQSRRMARRTTYDVGDDRKVTDVPHESTVLVTAADVSPANQ